MKLTLPSAKYQNSYLSYLSELGNEERYPFTLDLDCSDFNGLLKLLDNYSKGINLPEGSVTNTTLWLLDGDEIVGVTNIRHHLNSRIRECGGHIGLGVRPSFRGKGIGNKLMQLSIEYLARLGISEIHIHCYKDNVSSAKTIVNNGGKLISELKIADTTVQRFIVNA